MVRKQQRAWRSAESAVLVYNVLTVCLMGRRARVYVGHTRDAGNRQRSEALSPNVHEALQIVLRRRRCYRIRVPVTADLRIFDVNDVRSVVRVRIIRASEREDRIGILRLEHSYAIRDSVLCAVYENAEKYVHMIRRRCRGRLCSNRAVIRAVDGSSAHWALTTGRRIAVVVVVRIRYTVGLPTIGSGDMRFAGPAIINAYALLAYRDGRCR